MEEERDDEELNLTQKSLLEAKGGDMPEIPLCGFLSVRFYQPYFDVDTADVASRVAHAVFYCKREENFLAFIKDKPDAYGPFWICTTLVFTVAVASHINSWLQSWMLGKNWEYDFQSVLTASSVVYGFAAGAPLGIWFALRQLTGLKVAIITTVCLYGYSLTVFIPAVLCCLYPSTLLSWLAMLAATGTSTLFLLRNLAPVVISQAKQQAMLILGAVGVAQLVFGLSMKILFFSKA